MREQSETYEGIEVENARKWLEELDGAASREELLQFARDIRSAFRAWFEAVDGDGKMPIPVSFLRSRVEALLDRADEENAQQKERERFVDTKAIWSIDTPKLYTEKFFSC